MSEPHQCNTPVPNFLNFEIPEFDPRPITEVVRESVIKAEAEESARAGQPNVLTEEDRQRANAIIAAHIKECNDTWSASKPKPAALMNPLLEALKAGDYQKMADLMGLPLYPKLERFLREVRYRRGICQRI